MNVRTNKTKMKKSSWSFHNKIKEEEEEECGRSVYSTSKLTYFTGILWAYYCAAFFPFYFFSLLLESVHFFTKQISRDAGKTNREKKVFASNEVNLYYVTMHC